MNPIPSAPIVPTNTITQLNSIPDLNTAYPNLPALDTASTVAVKQIPAFFITDAGGAKAEGGKGQLEATMHALIPGPNSTNNPMEVLGAQMSLMKALISWEFTSQVASKIDAGVQSLFNSQV